MKIPDRELTVGPVTPSVPTQQFARPVAGAFTAATDAQENLAKVLQGHIAEQIKSKDDADLANLDSNFMLSVQDKLFSQDTEKYDVNGVKSERPKGIMNRQLGGTAGSAVEFEQYAGSEMQRLIATGRTPEHKARIQQRLMSTYMGARESVIRHEATQGRQSHIDAIEANQLKRQSEAAVIQTPESLVNALQISNENSDQLSTLKSLDPAAADIARKTDAAKMVETSATSVLTGPGGLEAAMKQVDSAKDFLLPDAYKDLQATLTTKWNTLESARLTMLDRQRSEMKMELVKKATTDGLTMNDFTKAAAAGAFETPAEAASYREMAIKGVNTTASTDAGTMKVLFDEMLTLGEASGELRSSGKVGAAKEIMIAPRVPAREIAQYQYKVIKLHHDGALTQDDASKLISATERIYDLAIRKEVGKMKSPMEHFANFVGRAQDDFDSDVQKRKLQYQREFLDRAVIGGEPPEMVSSEIMKRNLIESRNKFMNAFHGKEAGQDVTLPDGEVVRFTGLDTDGIPMFELKK